MAKKKKARKRTRKKSCPPATPVTWHEDLQFTFCAFCKSGRKCTCDAAEKQGTCDFCELGCDCGYDQVEAGEVCECACYCEDEEDGNCEECCECSYPLADDLPDMCYCECSCPKCECICHCGILTIDADSYNDWVREVCLVCDPECLSDEHLQIPDVILPSEMKATQRCIQDIGDYQFSVITLPKATKKKYPIPGLGGLGIPAFLLESDQFYEVTEPSRISIVQDGCKGSIKFSGPVHTATISKPHPYEARQQVWMSLTPMEAMSQKPGVDKAFGKVLIGGLGMGWLTLRVLEKPEVTSVTQVELDPDIMEFFSLPLLSRFPGRLKTIVGDIWEVLNRLNPESFDTILIDIWPTYTGARRDPNFCQLKKEHPNVWGWGEKPIIN